MQVLTEQLSLERGARHHVGTQVWHVLGATARSGICKSDAQVQQKAHGPHITSVLEGDLYLCLLHLARNREQVSRGLSTLVHSWCDLIKWKGEQEVLSSSVCYNQSKKSKKIQKLFLKLAWKLNNLAKVPVVFCIFEKYKQVILYFKSHYFLSFIVVFSVPSEKSHVQPKPLLHSEWIHFALFLLLDLFVPARPCLCTQTCSSLAWFCFGQIFLFTASITRDTES